MPRSGLAFATALLAVWGCGADHPLQPAPDAAPQPAALVVSGAVAATCELPLCAPGYGSQPVSFTPTRATPAGTIVFESEEGGSRQIWAMAADGSQRRPLTGAPLAYAENPKLSPDGTTVLLQGWADGDVEIYTIGVDGTGLTQLTDNEGIEDDDPAWSPDGARIVFESHVATDWQGTSELYVMNVDGSGVTQLTDNDRLDLHPAWSPDGERLAWEAGFVVHTMDIDGTDEAVLPGASWEQSPQWHPAGDRVLVQSQVEGNWELVVHQADGSGSTRLTVTSAVDETWPTWSPDGSHIAYHAEVDGDLEIYVMRADGTDVRRITSNAVRDARPSWGR